MTWIFVAMGIVVALAILHYWENMSKGRPCRFRVEKETAPGRFELVCYTNNPLKVFQAWIEHGLDPNKLVFKRTEL